MRYWFLRCTNFCIRYCWLYKKFLNIFNGIMKRRDDFISSFPSNNSFLTICKIKKNNQFCSKTFRSTIRIYRLVYGWSSGLWSHANNGFSFQRVHNDSRRNLTNSKIFSRQARWAMSNETSAVDGKETLFLRHRTMPVSLCWQENPILKVKLARTPT